MMDFNDSFTIEGKLKDWLIFGAHKDDEHKVIEAYQVILGVSLNVMGTVEETIAQRYKEETQRTMAENVIRKLSLGLMTASQTKLMYKLHDDSNFFAKYLVFLKVESDTLNVVIEDNSIGWEKNLDSDKPGLGVDMDVINRIYRLTEQKVMLVGGKFGGLEMADNNRYWFRVPLHNISDHLYK